MSFPLFDASKIKIRTEPLLDREVVHYGCDLATGPDSWVKAAFDPVTKNITILEISTTEKPLKR